MRLLYSVRGENSCTTVQVLFFQGETTLLCLSDTFQEEITLPFYIVELLHNKFIALMNLKINYF
jgi:hypothetical protein